MTDDLVVVVPEPEIIDITVDPGNPTVTIDDGSNVTTVQANPVEVLAVNDEVIVNVYAGSGSIMGQSALMEQLHGALGTDQFDFDLSGDMTLLRDLWTRVGYDIYDFLVTNDITSITQTSQTYTDTLIATSAVDIQANADGIIANASLISQTAASINLSVLALQADTENNLSVQTARIDINANAITSTVARIDSTDSTLSQAQSSITQLADSITSEVTARELLETGKVDVNTSTITQTAEAVTTLVTTTDTLTGAVDSAETRLTATEATTVILSEEVNNMNYSHKATQHMTSNSWGVSIEKTGGGDRYVSGFEMLLHPDWTAGLPTYAFRYVVGDTVAWTTGDVYICILDHIAETDNSPGGAQSATYWSLVDTDSESEFNVQVDNFKVITTSGPQPVFEVNTVTGEVEINGTLAVTNIESSNYDDQDPDESWFSINTVTGNAEFNNIDMVFGSASAKTAFINEVGIADAEQAAKDYADATFVTPAVLGDSVLETWYTSTDPSLTWSGSDASHTGDMWWNTTAKKLKRWGGTAWSTDLEDQKAIDAYANASTAQDTADGKRRVFVTTPSGPYDIGDLWADNDGVRRATANRATGYSASEWTISGDVTQTTIQGGLITTGSIKDSGSNLVIDFTNSAITVASASGLVVSAANGISVSSGGSILINDGGDLKLKASASSLANIEFLHGTTSAVLTTISTNYLGNFEVDATGTSIIRTDQGWNSIISKKNSRLTAISTSTNYAKVDTLVNTTTAESEVYIECKDNVNSTQAQIRTMAASNPYIYHRVYSGTYGTHQITMQHGLEIHTGLRALATTDTTYDSSIPNNGDYYLFAATNDYYRTWVRLRTSVGINPYRAH